MPRITSLDLQKMKADREPIAMVTAYDFTMARLVDSAGVDMVLVGDSLGMVVQGHQDTLSVTTEQMIYHGACVSRGLKRAHLTIDMPFMSYQVSPEQALETAGRLVKEGHAQSVKLEGGERSAPAISAIVNAGIPVVAHIGLTPQSVNALGGFKVQGRGDKAADQLLRDAQAVEAAGAFCVVLEMVPTEIAAIVSDAIGIPTIGIGAGVDCDGQVLVCNDLLGFDSSFKPKFVKRYAKLESTMVEAVADYVKEVRGKKFPTKEHTFHKRRGASKVAKIY